MKRRALIRHLEKHGCELFREGGKHTLYANRTAGKATTIPRHREINVYLAKRICRALDIPGPS